MDDYLIGLRLISDKNSPIHPYFFPVIFLFMIGCCTISTERINFTLIMIVENENKNTCVNYAT